MAAARRGLRERRSGRSLARAARPGGDDEEHAQGDGGRAAARRGRPAPQARLLRNGAEDVGGRAEGGAGGGPVASG